MDLLRISILIIILLVCFLSKVKGDKKVMPDDEVSQYTSDDSISGSGDIDTRGQHKIIIAL